MSFFFDQKTTGKLATALDMLSSINDNIISMAKALTATPDNRPAMAPIVVAISSTGTGQGIIWQTPDHIRLVSIIIGGTNSGRYTLQIGRGDVSRALWLQATQSQKFSFDDEHWEIPPGLEITVNSPSSAAWDAILTYYPAERYIGRR